MGLLYMTKEQKQFKGMIKADIITHWEAECRYYPVSVVRRDTIKKAYDITLEWLNSGDTV